MALPCGERASVFTSRVLQLKNLTLKLKETITLDNDNFFLDFFKLLVDFELLL